MNQAEIVEAISNMTVMEITELTKTLEEKFNVSGDVQMSTAPALVEEVEAEPTEFDVWIDSFGSKKIGVIKAVRAIAGLGLKESKELVESAPNARVAECVSPERAEEIKTELEEAGAKVALKAPM